MLCGMLALIMVTTSNVLRTDDAVERVKRQATQDGENAAGHNKMGQTSA